MDNPNVAPSGKPLEFLQTVPDMPVQVTSGLGTSGRSTGTPYQLSNTDAVSGATYSFGMQSPIEAQPPMTPQGSLPSFEKLQPKPMSTDPGPMGTDYKS